MSIPIISCALTLGLFCVCQPQPLYKEAHIMMGTTVEVKSADRRAANIVFREIKRIEDLFSVYKEDSEISKLNRIGELEVSPETLDVIKKAREFWKASDGAFDITVGPLIDLWGFRDKKYNLPKEKEIKKSLDLIGMDKIIFDDNKNVIKFKIPGMNLDLGGIAAGYAVDCAVRKLKEKGIKSCLINAGGDIYCLGDKFGSPWNVGIKNPRNPENLDYLRLIDEAVATSGDYEQYFIKDKRRYSHIFDPKTGYPADSGIISVTVVAPDCLTADVLSTAIFILGKLKGEELAKKFKDVEVRIVEEKDVSHN